MWLFQRISTDRKLKELLERTENLERDFKRLRGEWEDANDRLMKLVGRFTKRAQQIEQHEESVQTVPDTVGGSSTDTSRLDPMSQRILARRQRMFPVKKEA
jgi:phage shock protein A